MKKINIEEYKITRGALWYLEASVSRASYRSVGNRPKVRPSSRYNLSEALISPRYVKSKR